MKYISNKAIVTLVVSAGLFMLLVGLTLISTQPGFCIQCHNMKPYVVSWKSFPHKDVYCANCHDPKGFVGKLRAKLKAANEAYIFLSGQYTVITRADVPSSNCIYCHLGGNSKFPARLDRIHYGFVKENRPCLECHRQVGHRVDIMDGEAGKVN